MKMNILQEILEQLKQINEKLSTMPVMPVIHTYDNIKPRHIYNSKITDPLEYKERFQAKMNL